jgi:hypothetical protein
VLEEEELGRLHRLAEKSVDGEEAAAAATKRRTVKARRRIAGNAPVAAQGRERVRPRRP